MKTPWLLGTAFSFCLLACRGGPDQSTPEAPRGFPSASITRAKPGDLADSGSQSEQEARNPGPVPLRVRKGERVVELPIADLLPQAQAGGDGGGSGGGGGKGNRHITVAQVIARAFPGEVVEQVQFVSGDGTLRRATFAQVQAGKDTYRLRANQRGDLRAELPDDLEVVKTPERRRGGERAGERRVANVTEIVLIGP